MDPHASSLSPADAASAAALTLLDADRPSLGQMFRTAREQRGLTLQQISELTNIQLAHLEAYERDDLAGTVPGMYQRAEIRAIADAVGLDSRTALLAAERPAPPCIDIPAGLPDPAAPLTMLPADAPIPIAPVAAPRATVRGRQTSARRSARRSIKGDVVVGTLTVAVVALAWLTFRAPQAPNSAGRQPVAVAHEQPVAATHQESVVVAQPPSPAAPERSNAPASPPIASPSLRAVNHVVADVAAPVAPSLRVVTEPAGARVTVDGVGWGQTPLTIRYLPPGAKRIRVTHEGYAAREQVVAIAADQPQTIVRLRLQRQR
jgi:cytoskeletal protein RodZ